MFVVYYDYVSDLAYILIIINCNKAVIVGLQYPKHISCYNMYKLKNDACLKKFINLASTAG
jgi:hypothetical protein